MVPPSTEILKIGSNAILVDKILAKSWKETYNELLNIKILIFVSDLFIQVLIV